MYVITSGGRAFKDTGSEDVEKSLWLKRVQAIEINTDAACVSTSSDCREVKSKKHSEVYQPE